MGLTKEQAVRMAGSNWLADMSHRDIAMFQMHEPLLCMPFDVFHEAVEKALGRPVWTHEFGMNWDGIAKELRGERPAPTFEEIVDLLPTAKRVLLVIDDGR
jgi:hypothetical protein